MATPRSSKRKQLEELANQLIQDNDDLREEILQLRAAISLWAKVAEGTCLKCVCRNNEAVDLSNTGPDLVQVGEALRVLSDSDAAGFQ